MKQAETIYSASGFLPEKRRDDLVTQHVGAETLLYDEATHQAYCLNATAAAVWAACDGVRGVKAVAAAATVALEHPVSEELVEFALVELRRDGLLEARILTESVVFPSRREMLKKLGAGAVLLPSIAMIRAPMAAQIYNGCADC
jgi:hypothetical protein